MSRKQEFANVRELRIMQKAENDLIHFLGLIKDLPEYNMIAENRQAERLLCEISRRRVLMEMALIAGGKKEKQ